MNRIRIMAVVVLFPALATALTVEGTTYPPTVKLEGHLLRLVGAGLREKTIFKVDVYTMAVYAENRTCDHLKLINADEAKMIRMDFVRHVSGKKMMATMKDNFAKRTPGDASADLKGRIRGFLGRFKHDVKDGTSVRITYLPDKGTTVYIDDKQVGEATQGHDFQKVLWAIWFSRDTCCPNLIEDISETCKGK
ncbi:MAG: hypothetical protein GXP54_13700 [Deltaproteobacteria bacterium]|nr:hypothetical protein [Deltaproteobacteria bacterium]